jgi:DNA repair protein RecO (recombination protein O)
MKEQHSQAVVIRVIDHGESDKIVTFYCPELGRLTGIAKGAKRSKKRFVNKLELCSRLNIFFAPNRYSSLVRIDRAELINSYSVIPRYYQSYAGAMLICELLLNWSRENDGERELFRLLLWSLEQLDNQQPVNKIIIIFYSRMMDIAGYKPHFGGCLACGQLSPDAAPFSFRPGQHGIICCQCSPEKRTANPLAINTAKLLQLVPELPLGKVNRLQFSSSSLIEAMMLLKNYNNFLLQREMSSWNFLSITGGDDDR